MENTLGSDKNKRVLHFREAQIIDIHNFWTVIYKNYLET